MSRGGIRPSGKAGMPGEVRVALPGGAGGGDKPRDGRPVVEHRENRKIRRLKALLAREAARGQR